MTVESLEQSRYDKAVPFDEFGIALFLKSNEKAEIWRRANTNVSSSYGITFRGQLYIYDKDTNLEFYPEKRKVKRDGN